MTEEVEIEAIAQRFRHTRDAFGAHNASDEECWQEAKAIYEELKRTGKEREW